MSAFLRFIAVKAPTLQPGQLIDFTQTISLMYQLADPGVLPPGINLIRLNPLIKLYLHIYYHIWHM